MKFIYLAFIVPFLITFEAKALSFAHDVTTCLDRTNIWSEFRLGMEDSSESWLWPNSNSTVKGDGLIQDSEIRVTYQLGFSAPTYTYNLTNIIEGESFTYLANPTNHPFTGGATITLESIETQGTFIQWTGEYVTEPGSWLQRQIFKRYASGFFKALDKAIKTREELEGC